MNKKGADINFILRILVAVVVIVLLIYLFTNLGKVLWGEKDTPQSQARVLINDLAESVAKLKAEEKSEISILAFGPKDWGLLFFDYNVEKPEVCEGRCLCLCLDVLKLEDCDVCKEVEDKIDVEAYPYGNRIYLNKLPLEFLVKQEGSNFLIRVKSEEEVREKNQETFNQLLDYESGEERDIKQTVRLLVNLEEKSAETGSFDLLQKWNLGSSKRQLRRDLRKSLTRFFNERDLEGKFYIGKDAPADIFDFETRSYLDFVTSAITYEVYDDINNNKYNVIFNIIKKNE